MMAASKDMISSIHDLYTSCADSLAVLSRVLTHTHEPLHAGCVTLATKRNT